MLCRCDYSFGDWSVTLVLLSPPQAEVFVPLSARLYAAIARETSSERRRTSARVRELRSLPQEFWSIPEKLLARSREHAAKARRRRRRQRRRAKRAAEGGEESDPDARRSDNDGTSDEQDDEGENEGEDNCWAPAVAALNAIPAATLPSDKMDLLLHAVRQIELGGSGGGQWSNDEDEEDEEEENEKNERKSQKQKEEQPQQQLLGADDLFPVFVFVLSQADQLWVGGGVVVLRELLQHLANPERQRWSASAYYGATLEAAISHIASIARIRRKEGK